MQDISIETYNVLHWGTEWKKEDAVWDISPDSTLLGATDNWMNNHFAQSGLVFMQFWVFKAIFEGHGQNSQHLFCSVWTFYCTQNDRLNLTVSTQKSVWKTTHPGLRYLQKFILPRHTKPNRQPKMVFLKYLSPGWVIFQTDFCVETVRLIRSFWVQ